MAPKILLINPEKSGGKPYIIQPNLSLTYLAAALRDAGVEVGILDAQLEGKNAAAAARTCDDYDVVGITAFTFHFPDACEIARQVKKRAPDKPVVLGGPHVSALPVAAMKACPEFDYAVAGEGEAALPALLRLIDAGATAPEKLREVPGLVFRTGDEMVANEAVRLLPDQWPQMPAWELLDPRRYPLMVWGVFSKADKVVPIITGRGCPYNCDFCASELLYGRTVRRRPVETVMAEMIHLEEKYGFTEFSFNDASFLVDGRYVEQLCEAILRRGKQYWWSATVRLDAMTPALCKLMEQAGCYSLALGIESGSDRILEIMRKKITARQVDEQVRMIKENCDIKLTGLFIIGHPEERLEDIERTIALARGSQLDRAAFFNYLPLPGSSSYADLEAAGKLHALQTADSYMYHFPFEHPHVSNKKLKRLLSRAFFRFYLRPRIIFNILREIRTLDQLGAVMRRAFSIVGG